MHAGGGRVTGRQRFMHRKSQKVTQVLKSATKIHVHPHCKAQSARKLDVLAHVHLQRIPSRRSVRRRARNAAARATRIILAEHCARLWSCCWIVYVQSATNSEDISGKVGGRLDLFLFVRCCANSDCPV